VGAIVAALDVLNAREKAGVLWLLVIIAYGTLKGGRNVTSSLANVIRAFFQWKLQLIFMSAATYCAVVVLLASWAGIWHTTAAKETAYWFITGGVVLVGRAVSHAKPSDPSVYRELMRDAIRFTILIEFLVNLWVFPFLVELILVPVVLAFVLMQIVAASSPSYDAARKPIDGVLTIVGFGLLTYATVKAITDPSALFTRENAETLLVAPALTVAFVPLLWAWAWISRREQENLRKRFRATYDAAV
jgi:hypothetical protein